MSTRESGSDIARFCTGAKLKSQEFLDPSKLENRTAGLREKPAAAFLDRYSVTILGEGGIITF